MKLSRRDLTILGASLYLCEGTKARMTNRGWKVYAIEFTNKDPRTVVVFLKFLRAIIGADEKRVKGQLFIYLDHDEHELMKYWSEVSGIPLARFNKTIKLSRRNEKYIPNKLGTFKVRYSHKLDYLRIQDIIDDVFGGVA